MAEPSAIEHKAEAARLLLAAELRRHGRLVYSNSLGAEAMVLTDIIWSHLARIDVFTIDTGRLYEETYQLISPCTRAIQPGESRRAGRWWWERGASGECGLQRPAGVAVNA